MSIATQSWRIEIPDWRPKTTNELLALHYRARSGAKRIDAEMIGTYAALVGVPKATGRRRIDLEIRKRMGRSLDEDNAWKSLKDALVRLGLLVDDSPRWCDQGTPTFPRGPRRTVITLTDLDSIEE